jgi:hypothetical protein
VQLMPAVVEEVMMFVATYYTLVEKSRCRMGIERLFRPRSRPPRSQAESRDPPIGQVGHALRDASGC